MRLQCADSGCGTVFVDGSSTTRVEARINARRAGWGFRFVVAPDGRIRGIDTCPNHNQESK